jgi:hypothetical protein
VSILLNIFQDQWNKDDAVKDSWMKFKTDIILECIEALIAEAKAANIQVFLEYFPLYMYIFVIIKDDVFL